MAHKIRIAKRPGIKPGWSRWIVGPVGAAVITLLITAGLVIALILSNIIHNEVTTLENYASLSEWQINSETGSNPDWPAFPPHGTIVRNATYDKGVTVRWISDYTDGATLLVDITQTTGYGSIEAGDVSIQWFVYDGGGIVIEDMIPVVSLGVWEGSIDLGDGPFTTGTVQDFCLMLTFHSLGSWDMDFSVVSTLAP